MDETRIDAKGGLDREFLDDGGDIVSGQREFGQSDRQLKAPGTGAAGSLEPATALGSSATVSTTKSITRYLRSR